MRAACISIENCPYKSDTGYCEYTGNGCAKNLVRSVGIDEHLSYKIVRQLDVSDESIEKIAEAVAKKMYQQEEVEPVKRGKWIYDNQFHWYRASCSECGYKRVTDIKAEKWNGWKYCPNCGAKMENT